MHGNVQTTGYLGVILRCMIQYDKIQEFYLFYQNETESSKKSLKVYHALLLFLYVFMTPTPLELLDCLPRLSGPKLHFPSFERISQRRSALSILYME